MGIKGVLHKIITIICCVPTNRTKPDSITRDVDQSRQWIISTNMSHWYTFNSTPNKQIFKSNHILGHKNRILRQLQRTYNKQTRFYEQKAI